MIKIVALICARGGSKGIKNKNLLKINNKTLLRISIDHAKKINLIKQIYVSTDSAKIEKEARKCGAIVPFIRPKYLSSDATPEILVWRHAVNFLNNKLNIYPDYIVSIPTTSPLRRTSDIRKCLGLAIKNRFDIVFAITNSNKNPYFNMLIKKNGKLKIALKKNKNISRRQDAPKSFDLTTVCYVFKPDYIKSNLNLFSGKVGYVHVPKQRAVDIDDKWDYRIAISLNKYYV
jgi:CMP-N-acetylneuraminic acid synthetase